MSIFKYFSDEEHALSFVREGMMLWKPLSQFRVIEDNEVRGDARDGVLEHAPEGGLDIRGLDGKPFKFEIEPQRFVSSVKCDDIFVHCFSHDLSEKIAEQFGRFCVEIIDIERLIGRLRARACSGSKIDYTQLVSGSMDYRSQAQVPLADWAIPEKIVFIKPERFGWQNEFRIALPKRGAFDAENVVLTLETGEASSPPAPTQEPIFVSVGNLTEFCRLRVF